MAKDVENNANDAELEIKNVEIKGKINITGTGNVDSADSSSDATDSSPESSDTSNAGADDISSSQNGDDISNGPDTLNDDDVIGQDSNDLGDNEIEDDSSLDDQSKSDESDNTNKQDDNSSEESNGESESKSSNDTESKQKQGDETPTSNQGGGASNGNSQNGAPNPLNNTKTQDNFGKRSNSQGGNDKPAPKGNAGGSKGGSAPKTGGSAPKTGGSGGTSKASMIKNAAKNRKGGGKPGMPGMPGMGKPKKPKLPSKDDIKDGAKTAAKEGAKKAGKTAAKAMAKAGKAAIKGIAAGIKALIAAGPVGWIILAVILIVIILLIVLIAFGSSIEPGRGNDYKSENYFSEKDQKTLEKVNKIVSNDGNRPNPELALFAVAYPYYETLQDGSIDMYINKDVELSDEEKSWFQKWKEEKKEEILESFGCDDFCQDLLGETGVERIIKEYAKEYVKNKIIGWLKGEDEEEEDDDGLTGFLEAEDDPYLKLFRKGKYKSRFKKLLKKLNTNAEAGDYSLDTQEEFYEYLETYMKKDAGYKSLFAGVKDEEGLTNAIKEDLAQNAGMFSVYIGNNCDNSYTFTSAGQVTFDNTKNNISLKDLLSKNIVVDVKKEGCTATGKLNSCASIYPSPISMEKYIIGVTIQEVGESLSVEKFAANMVAEKSFAIGRAFERGNVAKIDENTYAIGIIDSTRDQAYCDYETLQYCSSGKSKLSEKQLATLKEAYEKTKNVYLWNGKSLLGSVCQNRSYAAACSCSVGTCLFQEEVEKGYPNSTYEEILKDQFRAKTVSLLTVENGSFSETLGTVAYNCANSNTNSCGIDEKNFKFYYQFNYKDYAFCGASSFVKSCSSGSNSICSSGCGVTSYAMLVANLAGDKSFDPPKASAEGAENGGCVVGSGTNDALFTSTLVKKHAGFSAETVPVSTVGIQKIKEILSQGGMVAANVQSTSPFTSGGHWILLRAITADGKVKVADPNSAERSTQETYNLDDFVKNNWLNGHSWIAVKGPGSGNVECENPSDSYEGDGIVTGYLKSPLGPNMTEAQTKSHANCSGLYYCGSSSSYHGGIDFGQGVNKGDPIYAMDGGKVIRAGWGGAYGNYVVIEHKTTKGTYYTLYAHMTSILTSTGKTVSQGQKIGTLGTTGHSTGYHLHAELLKSISCLGHTCRGTHYNVLKYIGIKKTYVGQKCDGLGC